MEPYPRVPSMPSKVALSIKLAAALIIVLAIYSQDLSIVANEALQSEIMSYILVIPILFLYILYRKRKLIKAAISFDALKTKEKTEPPDQIVGAVLHKKPTPYFSQIYGVLICLTAFLLYWHGSYTFYPLEYHMISLPIFISGTILVLFNTKTLKALLFPIALLIFLTPPPLEILNSIGSTLSILSSQAAYTVLKTIGVSVSLASQYGTPVIVLSKATVAPMQFTVDVACAGLYSLSGFIIFATFIAYIAKTQLPKKAIIFIIGIPLMVALNITRIITILVIGNQYGEALALQIFHLAGGFTLILIGSLILITVAEKFFKIQFFNARPKAFCSYCNPHPNPKHSFCINCGRITKTPTVKLTKQDLGKILAIIICALIVLNIQAPVFALTNGPVKLNTQTLSGQQTTTKMLPEMPGYTSMFYYRDTQFEEYSQEDASLIYAYYSNDTSKNTIWVSVELAQTRAAMHPWEVCLITWQIAHGYQPKVEQIDQRDIRIIENPPVTARFFSFKDIESDLFQVILYWYEVAFFNTTTGMAREYTKISFVAFTQKLEDIPSVENQLLPFAKSMMERWLPIKSWSLVALLISQNGLILIAITTTLLAILLAYQIIKNEKRKEFNLKAYNKLVSEQERLILQTINKTQNKNKTTVNSIAKTYTKLANHTVDPKILLDELNRAEQAGLVKADLANQDDQPTLIWETQTPLSKSSLLSEIRNIFSSIL